MGVLSSSFSSGYQTYSDSSGPQRIQKTQISTGEILTKEAKNENASLNEVESNDIADSVQNLLKEESLSNLDIKDLKNQNEASLQTNSNPPTMNINTKDIDMSENQISPEKSSSQASSLPQSSPTQGQQSTSNLLQSRDYSLADLLNQAIKFEASDIHLSEGYRAIVRVDGDLKTINSSVLTPPMLNKYAEELMTSRKDISLEEVTEVDLGYDFDGRRFRVNIYKTMGSFSIVCRLIPNKIKTVEELELPPVLKQLGTVSNGLVLVTGPTGSGKSTSLASILNYINTTMPKHIVTIEDPIEFVYPKAMALVDQRQLGQDFNSWPVALKSLLRQDPDVVLVGEMRDLDTIESTITVAETGHLVFATLHTNSAAQSIDRIIDVFPEGQQAQIRAQLGNVLVAVVSQRLIPLSQGGRKAVLEFMLANSAVKNAIREGKTYQIDNMIQTGQESGMISMEKTLADLVKQGSISLEVAKATTNKHTELELYLKGK